MKEYIRGEERREKTNPVVIVVIADGEKRID